MRVDNVNKVIEILLNLANIADEKEETPFDKEMGLGYRAFTGYIREGVQGIIKLQSDYYSACYSRDMAKEELKDNKELLKRIFGTTDITEYNDEDIAKIKAVVKEIEKQWESDGE